MNRGLARRGFIRAAGATAAVPAGAGTGAGARIVEAASGADDVRDDPGKRIHKLDVKDRTKAKEERKIGDGEADWPALREALAEIGYRGWAAAEVCGGDRARLAAILARMNRVLGESDGKPGGAG